MADDIDRSSEVQAERLEYQINQQLERSKSAPRLTQNGECYNPLCADEVAEGKIFCGAECAKQYQIYGE